jgi:hypothetical protein
MADAGRSKWAPVLDSTYSGEHIMSILDQWENRNFGYWKEWGTQYQDSPSIYDFVFPNVVATYDKTRLREYLTQSQIVAVTSRWNFPCPFTGERVGGSLAAMTDGEWTWLSDLPDYIEQFNVAIPTAWLQKIIARNYIPPPPIDEEVLWERFGPSAPES